MEGLQSYTLNHQIMKNDGPSYGYPIYDTAYSYLFSCNFNKYATETIITKSLNSSRKVVRTEQAQKTCFKESTFEIFRSPRLPAKNFVLAFFFM
jgi:hypothetical protein